MERQGSSGAPEPGQHATSLEASATQFRGWARRALGAMRPSLRFIAESVLAQASRIDWVALDEHDGVVLVVIGRQPNDPGLLTRGLAQRAWLMPRLADWSQLAPGLDLRPDASVGLILMAPAFDPDTLLASHGLEEPEIELIAYRPRQTDDRQHLQLEPVDRAGAAREVEAPKSSAHGSIPRFRSGLSEQDLRISPEENRELE